MTRTTIALEKETRDLLASFGKKDQSFDEIVLKLIKRKEAKN